MKEYRNFIADNRRWAGFEPRPDDIFVCSPPKCGTTRVQKIFEGGIESFLFKGDTGRWRDLLTAKEVRAYEERLADALPCEAATWLEYGRKRR